MGGATAALPGSTGPGAVALIRCTLEMALPAPKQCLYPLLPASSLAPLLPVPPMPAPQDCPLLLLAPSCLHYLMPSPPRHASTFRHMSLPISPLAACPSHSLPLVSAPLLGSLSASFQYLLTSTAYLPLAAPAPAGSTEHVLPPAPAHTAAVEAAAAWHPSPTTGLGTEVAHGLYSLPQPERGPSWSWRYRWKVMWGRGCRRVDGSRGQ